MGEFQHLNDPNYAIQLAVGPPFPNLIPQNPNSGLRLAGRCENSIRRFVFKKAHLSGDDFRVFDSSTGHPVAVMHHFGKNPYGALDPLQLGGVSNAYGNESKLKSMSVRSNLAICRGESKDVVYRVLPDLMGRTMQIVTHEKEELVCFVQKTTKAMIMEAALGSGSEMVIDVAPGVDWTAMIAILMSVQQVGAHFLKDAVGNWVVDPLKGQAVQGVIQGAGMEQYASEAGQSMDSAIYFVRKMQDLQRMFFV